MKKLSSHISWERSPQPKYTTLKIKVNKQLWISNWYNIVAPKGTNNMKFLKSRTLWTLLFMVLFNGFQAIESSIPQELFLLINTVLAGLAGYFRIDARIK